LIIPFFRSESSRINLKIHYPGQTLVKASHNKINLIQINQKNNALNNVSKKYT